MFSQTLQDYAHRCYDQPITDTSLTANEELLLRILYGTLPASDIASVPQNTLLGYIRHAWVEVYADGKWNFLGACEPEPALNLGWFNDASSRALSSLSRELTAFAQDPQLFMEEIRLRFSDGNLRYYPVLWMTPAATLRLGHTDKRGRNLLWVAGMRTMGIPARLNPANEMPEYWTDGAYHTLAADYDTRKSQALHQTTLRLPKTPLVYGVHYSLSLWAEDHYLPLAYTDDDFKLCEEEAASQQISIAPGDYRLLTAHRLPNGNQLCHSTYFRIHSGETLALPLVYREASPEAMLSHYQLRSFSVTTLSGDSEDSHRILRGVSRLFWLDPGTEPTEHVLNELLFAQKQVARQLHLGNPYVFFLKDASALENPTLQKVLRVLPEIALYLDPNGAANNMAARKMFLEPGLYPLLLLTDADHIGYYGSCGYQVGAVSLLLNLDPQIHLQS